MTLHIIIFTIKRYTDKSGTHTVADILFDRYTFTSTTSCIAESIKPRQCQLRPLVKRFGYFLAQPPPSRDNTRQMEGLQAAWASVGGDPTQLEAILDCADRDALCHACLRHPALVRAESPPALFDGAQLCQYWGQRRAMFGKDAYKPLELLSEYAESGVLVALPQGGNHVALVYEATRRPRGGKAMARAMFWMLQQLMGKDVTFVWPVSAKTVDLRLAGDGVDVEAILSCMPVNMKEVCFVGLCKAKAERQWFLKELIPIVEEPFTKVKVRSRIISRKLHKVQEQLDSKLVSYPKSMGGNWDYSEWKETLNALKEHGFSSHNALKRPISEPEDDSKPEVKKLKTEDPDDAISSSAAALLELQESPPSSPGRLESEVANASVVGENTNIGSLSAVFAPTLRTRQVAAQPVNPLMHLMVNAKSAALRQMELALQLDSIPKREFMVAQKIGPTVVAAESDPWKFLQVSGLDAIKAAEMLAKYWSQRCEIYGNAAFAPLAEQMRVHSQLLSSGGYGAILPRDQGGSPVLCLDMTRPLDCTIEMALQCAFAVLQQLSQNELAQADGVTLIGLVTGAEANITFYRAMELLRGLPVKFKAYHIFNCLPVGCNSVATFEAIVSRSFRPLLESGRVHLHSSQDRIRNLQMMALQGISPAGLPACVGGLWQGGTSAVGMDALHQQSPTICLSHGTMARHSSQPNSFDAAMTQVHSTKRIAYGEACLRVTDPVVWKDEANPELFVRVEKGDTMKAVKRMASYWNLRSEVCNKKRFLTLSQTGEGALGRKDLAALGSGFVTLLPLDDRQRSVIWIDSLRLPDEASSSDCINRCLLYMFSLLTENTVSQDAGVVILYRIDTPLFGAFDKDVLERIVSCLPLKVAAFHFVGLKKHVQDASIPNASFADNNFTHVCETPAEICQSLSGHGIEKEALPKYAGGTWAYSKFVQWQELRTRVEWNVPLGLSGRENAESSFPAIKAFELLGPNEKAERTRRLNVIHTRRKRDKMRVDADLLEEQCVELREARGELEQEGELLKRLLDAAAALIP